MAEGGVADGAAHEEYARTALFLMSAACEHPSLTPQCPFAVEVRPGVRVCQEQCHDVLVANGLPLPTFVDAPSNPAPRRPFAVSAAFDASALYLQAQDRRPSRWSVPALVWALKQHVSAAPVDLSGRTRQEEVELCLAELARRDFDVDSLVRLGMGDDVLEALIVGMLIPRLARGAGVPVVLAAPDVVAPADLPNVPDVPDAWHALLDEVLAREAAEVPSELPLMMVFAPEDRRAASQVARVLRGSFPRRLAVWVATAPLADVVSWAAPTVDGFPEEAPKDSAEPTKEQRDRQRWLVDRFTVAYYDRWSRESRHLEFRWLRNDVDPPCAAALMDVRERREDDLAKTIAVAAVLAPVGPEQHLTSLRQKGVELLAGGRRAAAAAVFEAVRELDWDLPEPHNNYGFALLPDSPEEALKALRLAKDLGYTLTVNTANQVLALALLGRDDEAFALAEAVLARFDSEDADESLLWDPGSALAGEPVLEDLISPRDYVLEVAALVAERAGDDDAARRWRHELDVRSDAA